jgi:hypothetical protein
MHKHHFYLKEQLTILSRGIGGLIGYFSKTSGTSLTCQRKQFRGGFVADDKSLTFREKV